jgi:hypothetical protein
VVHACAFCCARSCCGFQMLLQTCNHCWCSCPPPVLAPDKSL